MVRQRRAPSSDYSRLDVVGRKVELGRSRSKKQPGGPKAPTGITRRTGYHGTRSPSWAPDPVGAAYTRLDEGGARVGRRAQ